MIAETAQIPNDTISFASDVPDNIRSEIVTALLDISNGDNASVLSDTYNWDALEVATDAFFDDFRQQLDAAGVSIEELN